MNFNIHGIFPQPVFFSHIGRTWTKEEQAFLQKQSESTHNNSGNTTSNNRYVLREPEAKDMADFVQKAVDQYVDNVMFPKFRDQLEFYVTQSWLNYTKPGQYHHKHAHPNSILSGVLYIDADETKDKIFFYKDGYQQIKFPTENFQLYNSESWFFTVKTGDIVIFPSSLTHMVETKEGENTRTSLAFNVFAKGYIGNEDELTALQLHNAQTSPIKK
jgi:uncharacterized protein (TIGR02466 family)